MSWMDSWSRPSKNTATPPPLYLTDPTTKYCTSCGRVISDRKSHHKTTSKASNNEGKTPTIVIKYCSDSCRKRRINPLDKRIDRTILALLRGDEGSGIEKIDAKLKARSRKGENRNLIGTDDIESIVFERKAGVGIKGGSSDIRAKTDDDDEDVNGGGVVIEDDGEESDPYEVQDKVAMESQGNRPNPSGPGSAEKREAGQKRADEREAVRRAARRAVVFGFVDGETASKGEKSDDVPKRKCEAVMNGQVVEPSFAKGNWSIRWREQNE